MAGKYLPGRGIGHDVGYVDLEPQEALLGVRRVQAGRFLMKGEWNTQLYAPLLHEYHKGRELRDPRPGFAGPRVDVLFHKNRISGLCDSNRRTDGNDLFHFLEEHRIRTLLFTGIHVDLCVLATCRMPA